MPDLMKIKPDNVRFTSALVNPSVLKLSLVALIGDLPSKTKDQPETGRASFDGSGSVVAP